MSSPLCLIVTNNFPPVIGGAGTVYAALARAGAGRIHVLCAGRDYRTGAPIPDAAAHDAQCGFSVHRIADIRPPLGQPARLRELAIRWRLFLRVRRLYRQYRFPVLMIADDETVGWLIAPAQRLLGLKVVLYTHGDDLGTEPPPLHARRARQFARADAVVAISETAAEALATGYGMPRSRVILVPNGIDTARYHPMAADAALVARYGLAGQRVITTVTRLVPRKGVDRVLDAMPALLRDIPNLHYIIVGDGPQRAELEARAAQPDLAGHVTLTGVVAADDVPRYLALAECMVMPNRRMPNGEDDGASLVFLEANACGKPVIAGRAGAARELAQDGVNGLVVDGTNPAAIAAALRRLLTKQELAARLAANGLAMARDASWERRARPFLDLCERLARAAKS